MKKIFLHLILILCSCTINAQSIIMFKSYFCGFGQYTEIRDDPSKMKWTESQNNIYIDLSNNTIKIGTRNFYILKKIDLSSGFVAKCNESGGYPCRISYSLNQGNIHIITLEQSGIIFSYTDALDHFKKK